MPASTAPVASTSSTPAKPSFWESLFGNSKKPNAAVTGGRRRNKMRSMSRKNLKTRKVRKSHSRRH